MTEDPKRWSQPFAHCWALTMHRSASACRPSAERDSMSGTFNDIDGRPPWLLSLRMWQKKAGYYFSGAEKGRNVLILSKTDRDAYDLPVFAQVMKQ